jgi:hypothetical protein
MQLSTTGWRKIPITKRNGAQEEDEEQGTKTGQQGIGGALTDCI